MAFSRFIQRIFGVLLWLASLFLVVILYHYTARYVQWSPTALGYLDRIYQVLKIFLIAGSLTSIVGTIFHKIRHSRAIDTKLIRRFLPIIQFGINLAIWVVAGFLTLEAIGINTKNILTGAGIGGAILALAYKDLLTNLLGSLSILFSKTFEIGEVIRIRTIRVLIEGMVEEITLNHTKITNKSGEVVYIPNKTIYSEVVENLSRRRFHSYELIIPFAKTEDPTTIKLSMKLIEDKINSFYPLRISYESANPNATDFIYIVSVDLPEQSDFFENEMRKFLMEYIFGRGSHKTPEIKSAE